jgi:hypothetical protein
VEGTAAGSDESFIKKCSGNCKDSVAAEDLVPRLTTRLPLS